MGCGYLATSHFSCPSHKAILCGFSSFFFMAINVLHGQTGFSGKVLSKQDSTPIADAHVIFSDGLTGTSTNDEGRFFLPVAPLNAKIQIRCIGFNPKTVEITTTDEVIILMSPSVSLLEEVVVTYREDSAKKNLKKSY